MDKKLFLNYARFLMNKHNLQNWEVKINTNKRRLGVCKFGKKRLEFSIYHVENSSFEKVNNTLLHEIAHALVGIGHGHNKTWKQKAVEIGCNGQRCGQFDIEIKPKHIYQCISCDKKFNYHRKMKNFVNRYHSPCKNKSGNGAIRKLK